jgi:membrane protein implicated in regulation of membrane protease activity
MNRTRYIFLFALAACLLILAASLARQMISTGRLLQIYVASTIFAGGVVLLDVAGVLGGHHADGFAAHDTPAHDFGGQTGGHEGGPAHDLAGQTGGHDGAPSHDAGGHDGAGNGHTAPGHAGEHVAAHAAAPDAARVAGGSEAQATTAAHIEARTAPSSSGNAAPILSILTYLRLLVYFCLGFGPAGWAGLASGWGALRSLLLAVPIGLLALLAARAFFRFQRRDTGAVPAEIDLLHEKAEVIVPLDDETMGKVRVSVGMSVSDVYALAAERGRHYERGDVVQIVQVADDCVHVR